MNLKAFRLAVLSWLYFSQWQWYLNSPQR